MRAEGVNGPYEIGETEPDPETMLMAPAAEFRRLRAPQEDGQTLVDPPVALLPEVVARNRRQLAATRYDLQGQSLLELAASARQGLLRAAIEYTAKYRGVSPGTVAAGKSQDLSSTPLVVSGHQPQLFHAGVWYKNFVLGRLAREVGGIGVHLVIDSDLCRGVSIRVPTGSIDRPRVEAVEFDRPANEVPFEQRQVRDEAIFATFAQRVMSQLQPLVREPIVETLWPLVRERCGHEPNLGLRLAQGRHALEETWNNDTLELPQSAVCRLPEFAWFVAHLLAQLPRFWSIHNDTLAAYRAAHHLRNRAHPVPDLMESDGWLEAPFWIWTADDPHRRPLFARMRGDGIEITDRHAHTATLAFADDSDATAAVEQLLALAEHGVKIRTRALTTTLFARLLLGDVFLHGIGGAKYDQVTDAIARQFCGFSLPEFATVSATLRLPIEHARDIAGRPPAIDEQLRTLRYHPERFVETNGATTAAERARIEDLIETKRRWIETAKTPENAQERHVAISDSNERLQPFVAPLRRSLEANAIELENRRRANAILNSREYSFCLFPRRHLERLVLDGAAPAT